LSNAPLIWKLAREYKAGMDSAIHTSRSVIQEFLMEKLLGEDDEEASGFDALGLYMNNSFLISNLGVFEERRGMGDGGWSVGEVGFSAGAIRASMGDLGMSFNVASVKGGGCVVSFVWEEGVLEQVMVGAVCKRVRARLKSVI
jgi:hypothetical protein